MSEKIELTEDLAGNLLNLIRVGVYPTVNGATFVAIHDDLLDAIKAAGINVYPVEVPREGEDEAVANAVVAD